MLQAATALLTLGCLPGCSLMLMDPVREPRAGEALVSCEEDPMLPPIDFTVAALAAGTGIWAIHADQAGGCGSCEEKGVGTLFGVVMVALAGAYIVSGGHGVHSNRSCAEMRHAHPLAGPQAEPEAAALTARRETLRRAWELTKAAATASGNGDCAKVKQFEVQVKALDIAFHDTTFRQDAAIAACLKWRA
jgi:hypothetical protein